jgi:hypothetical protein
MTSTKSSVVLDREPDQEKSLDPPGPRIRCPLCGWSPRKDDVWSCSCGNHWNTFDTGGVCPACLRHEIQSDCVRVHSRSVHEDLKIASGL